MPLDEICLSADAFPSHWDQGFTEKPVCETQQAAILLQYGVNVPAQA